MGRCRICGKTTFSIDEILCYKHKLEKEREYIKKYVLNNKGNSICPVMSSYFIACPYCGDSVRARIDKSFEYEAKQEGDHVMECRSCGEEFMLSTYCQYSYKTEKLEAKG